ncbi:stromal interaction molecule 2-like [Penaeus japonicus]|uniref:stromal interaction molecule 2-like n=1 Tax=Penaeus japonicus TaxID=27405 RepID=UPI001C71030D|nr:stromal interaction molecule 2-like [Penaeus japonicus]
MFNRERIVAVALQERMMLVMAWLFVFFSLIRGVTSFNLSGYGVTSELMLRHSTLGNRLERSSWIKGCVPVDELCLVPEEVPNYEAIKSLHSQLDDDRSGDIDVSESVEFLKEELQYAKGYEKRQKVFHSNNDQYVSVRELWHMWKKSEVHNWTVEQTVTWLAESVELQQYAQNFYANAVNGSVLPSTVLSVLASRSERRSERHMLERLAANNEQDIRMQ